MACMPITGGGGWGKYRFGVHIRRPTLQESEDRHRSGRRNWDLLGCGYAGPTGSEWKAEARLLCQDDDGWIFDLLEGDITGWLGGSVVGSRLHRSKEAGSVLPVIGAGRSDKKFGCIFELVNFVLPPVLGLYRRMSSEMLSMAKT